MYQIGWFSTGRDKAACDLLEVVLAGIERREIEAELSFVFSNREPGEARESDMFFDLVRDRRIPCICFPFRKFAGRRSDYDREVLRRIAGFHPDLCVLAGYMLIVGEEMCQRYNMINLHPAAPGGPSGTWQEVIWKLIEGKAGETGVMMHLVTPELDKGPPATYCTFSIRGEPFDEYWAEIEGHPWSQIKEQQGESYPLFKLIRQYGLAREFPLIVATLKAFSEGRVRVEGGEILGARGRPVEGYDLTDEIGKVVAG